MKFITNDLQLSKLEEGDRIVYAPTPERSPKKPNWYDRFSVLSPGESLRFGPYKIKANAISYVLRKLAPKHPDRRFEVEDDGQDVFIRRVS